MCMKSKIVTVLVGVKEGMSKKEIAEKLGVTQVSLEETLKLLVEKKVIFVEKGVYRNQPFKK